MAAVFEIPSFWESRFRVDGDRGFLNCLVKDPRNYESKDWRLIYKSTAITDRSSLHLLKMQPPWLNNRWLKERCSMTRATDEQIASEKDLLNQLPWKGVYTQLRCDGDNRRGGDDSSLCENCLEVHVTFIQPVLLQDSVISVAVSVLREWNVTYITGFELISAESHTPNIILGYRLPGGQVIIDTRDQQLRGFTVISGEGGIHAIRPIFNTHKTIASWIGRPEGYGYGICHSMDLVLQQGIKAFLGKFDVSHCCQKTKFVTDIGPTLVLQDGRFGHSIS
jgi:hypothetical protein